MPKRKVFVDSSVLIRGLLFEQTNSALILKMISRKELMSIINRKVAFEVLNVLKELKDKDFASLSFSFIHCSSGIFAFLLPVSEKVLKVQIAYRNTII